MCHYDSVLFSVGLIVTRATLKRTVPSTLAAANASKYPVWFRGSIVAQWQVPLNLSLTCSTKSRDGAGIWRPHIIIYKKVENTWSYVCFCSKKVYFDVDEKVRLIYNEIIAIMKGGERKKADMGERWSHGEPATTTACMRSGTDRCCIRQ